MAETTDQTRPALFSNHKPMCTPDFFPLLAIDARTFEDTERLEKLSKLRPYYGAAWSALEDFSETYLAERMCSSMDSEEVPRFADELRRAADLLEKQRANESPEPSGLTWSLKDALKEIREAADWYEQVGELGCGVKYIDP